MSCSRENKTDTTQLLDISKSLKLRSVYNCNAERVEVNLAGVAYMDSSGVATLVEGFKKANESSKTFTLVAPSDSVMKVLQLAKLDGVFEIDRAP